MLSRLLSMMRLTRDVCSMFNRVKRPAIVPSISTFPRVRVFSQGNHRPLFARVSPPVESSASRVFVSEMLRASARAASQRRKYWTRASDARDFWIEYLFNFRDKFRRGPSLPLSPACEREESYCLPTCIPRYIRADSPLSSRHGGVFFLRERKRNRDEQTRETRK